MLISFSGCDERNGSFISGRWCHPRAIPCKDSCAARGKLIAGCKKFFCSLSEVHSNTGRLLFKFNHLQYTLAAPEVFVAFANPVSLPSGYRVGIIRITNIDQIETIAS